MNTLLLLSEVRHAYRQALDASHSGHPVVVYQERSGRRGRPRVVIDPVFLRWAIAHRGATAIARFLGCSRTTVRNALLDHGILEPGSNPFPTTVVENTDDASNVPPVPDLLLVVDDDPAAPPHLAPPSSTAVISTWTDDELDDAIHHLRIHFPRAGGDMINGMLRRLGHRVPMRRIRESIHRIDPVRRVFGRLQLTRRVYHVSGPNALWHHDGQHGASHFLHRCGPTSSPFIRPHSLWDSWTWIY